MQWQQDKIYLLYLTEFAYFTYWSLSF